MSGNSNPADLATALEAAVATALADMAFLDAAPADLPPEGIATSHIVAVGFARPIRGQIALLLSLDAKRAVVENVHGRAWEELSAAEIDDCLLELGNVAAGNFLNVYCGRQTAHDVSLPSLLFDAGELAAGRERATASFDAEGHPLGAVVTLE